ncbi:MAG: hypothetical protein J6M12_01540, partial [Clostridia bacterium]|nr:hypothetical protein [Clostridia bacterium]
LGLCPKPCLKPFCKKVSRLPKTLNGFWLLCSHFARLKGDCFQKYLLPWKFQIKLFFASGEKLPKCFPKENTSFAEGKHHVLFEDTSFFRKAKKHHSY